jgi:hypothetical protein
MAVKDAPDSHEQYAIGLKDVCRQKFSPHEFVEVVSEISDPITIIKKFHRRLAILPRA